MLAVKMEEGKRAYPFKWVELPQEETNQRAKLFHPGSIANPMVCSVPGNVYLPKKFAGMAEQIYNMEVRPDDIWILTYPESPTTWMQELVWQVANGVILSPGKDSLYMRSPFVEMSIFLPGPIIPPSDPVPQAMIELVKQREPNMDPRLVCDSVSYVETLKGPRILKSHLPIEMLPPDLLKVAKVIYVCRDPRDVCVSFYHHTKLFEESYHYQGDFHDYAKLFLKGKLNYGCYWHHFKNAWNNKDHPNLMFLRYKDMKKNLIKVIKDISTFTGHHLTQYKVLLLDDALYVDNYRKMAADEKVLEKDKEIVKKFIRKGKVGDHKNFIQGDHLEVRFKKWIEENTQGTDLPKFYLTQGNKNKDFRSRTST